MMDDFERKALESFMYECYSSMAATGGLMDMQSEEGRARVRKNAADGYEAQKRLGPNTKPWHRNDSWVINVARGSGVSEELLH